MSSGRRFTGLRRDRATLHDHRVTQTAAETEPLAPLSRRGLSRRLRTRVGIFTRVEWVRFDIAFDMHGDKTEC